jgi:hypothetical protein
MLEKVVYLMDLVIKILRKDLKIGIVEHFDEVKNKDYSKKKLSKDDY